MFQQLIYRSIISIVLSTLISTVSVGQNGVAVDTIVKGVVVDERSRKGVEATITVVGSDDSDLETATDKKGSFYLTSDQVSPAIAYVLCISHPNEKFLLRTQKLYFTELDSDRLPLSMEVPVRLIGCVLEVPWVYFERNSSKVSPEGMITLDMLVETLNDNPSVVLELAGHAECSEQDPFPLSLQRAEAAMNYMLAGTEKERLVPIARFCAEPYVVDGYNQFFSNGQELTAEYISTLSDSAAIEQAQRLNRRVQFKVLRTDHVPKN